ncbi:MAG: hypothetical protein EA362_07135 [Saprospirales bacterium]|nr:MAG: hypothetical protein EA362_07135 [Saprospirales bacterium]
MAVKICILLIFGFYILDLPSQNTLIQGKVVDHDGQPLYLVLVYNADLGIGAYTEENGHFKINTDKQPSELEVFALGFLRKNVVIESQNSFLKIELAKLAYELEEIRVFPCPKVEFTMGIDPRNEKIVEFGGPFNISYQAGTSFPTHYGQEITAVEVLVINPKLQRAKFRLRIYSIDSLGKPNTDLLLQNVIVSVPGWRQKRATRIDLNDYNLRSPDTGILVAMEWLPSENNAQRTTGRNAIGQKVESHWAIPRLGLIRTRKNPDFKMWSKIDEREWGESSPPIMNSKDSDEVYLPVIRVHLLDCE